jgi:hypothetical protein
MVCEGRLLDFLLHSSHSNNFTALRRFVHKALEDGDTRDPMLLVNLNLRAVVWSLDSAGRCDDRLS